MSNKASKNSDKNNTGVIIGLGAALVVGAIVLSIALISAFGNSEPDNDITYYSMTSGVYVSQSDDINSTENDFFNEPNENYAVSSNNVVDNIVTGQVNTNTNSTSTSETITTPPTTKNEAVEKYEQLSKNGDNILSDHYDNKFIKLISEKYNVDEDLLVAIYSEPDTGNNFVLEFNGEKDADGNIIKSPDTLEKVYQIDKAGSVKIATGRTDGNVGVSYAEGMFCFNMVKTLVMEQYPEYFTGLKK